MKKSIIIAAVTALVFSCKKETTPDFTPTDVTGTTTVKGNLSKNAIVPNGSGGYSSTGQIPAAGVNISIKVNKKDLYPNSVAQGADVYTGTSDVNGNFSIEVKSNASGVPAMITIEGFTGTLDTLLNKDVHKGLQSTFTGTALTKTLFMGQNVQLDFEFQGSSVNSANPTLRLGTAIVAGSIGISIMKETQTGTAVIASPYTIPRPGTNVFLNLNKDPFSLSNKIYQTTTDDNGYYRFTINTVAAGTAGFPQIAQVWINDLETTRDTLKIGNTTPKTGRMGVYSMKSFTINGVYNDIISNANHIVYSTFVPN